MILVVADTTPLRYLVEIGYEHLLPRLFTKVWIPSAVAGEMRRQRTPAVVRNWAEQLPSWIEVRKIEGSPSEPELAGLDRGEWEAIELARAIHANLLLIDERTGARMARAIRFHFDRRDAGTPREDEFSRDPGSVRPGAGAGSQGSGKPWQ